ncbi:hypothetical protein BJY24_001670 [Nocardia transvalensis]|uniref:Uncharacterized protein n=1 Tax=Nocardia transvalensis TaxID=37333 RepID=A0A7W9PBU7_9NOCA|nr:hypothetical protein [Nocardia transvalensis]MBB5912803.1 hypothetical protein [Nocardia transvalensis]
MRRTTGLLAAGLLAASLLAGCGSGGGAAVPADPVIDIKQLDLGPYSGQPHDMGTPKNNEAARMIEAERLGNFVPLPMDIDPAFVHPAPFASLVFVDPKDSLLNNIIKVDTSRFAEDAPDFISGFASYARNDPYNEGMELANTVMLFPDEQKAANAAAALERTDAGFNDRNQPVSLPKYPGVHAHWDPTVQSIGSWYATGRYVVYTWIYDQAKAWLNKVDLPALTTLLQKSLDVVVPSIAKFTPHPPDTLMSQPIDDEAMLRRTLIRPKEDTGGAWLNPPGVYNAHSALHFNSNPDETKKVFEDNGVDKFADYGNQLFRARDAESAKKVRDEFGGPTKHFHTAESPANLPVAKCREYHGKEKLAVRYYCAVSYDRYAALAWGSQLLDAQQRISAQYAMLVNAA